MPLCPEQTYDLFFFLIHLLSVHLSGLHYGHMSRQRISLHPSLHQHPSSGVIKQTALCTEDHSSSWKLLLVIDFCQLMHVRLFFLLLFSTASRSYRRVHNQRMLTDRPLLGQVFGPRSIGKDRQNYCPFPMGRKLDALEV